jgi:hypothetical protein
MIPNEFEAIIDVLLDKMDTLPPVMEVMEAKKKLLECAMWIQAALDTEGSS